MVKLTDLQKKKIIADYLECQNYSETARRNNISHTTVINFMKEADEDILKKLQHKKQENTKDILNHLESKKDAVCEILDKFLVALADDEKIEKSSLQQIATSMAIVIDKFTKDNIQTKGNTSEHNDLIEAIKNISQR